MSNPAKKRAYKWIVGMIIFALLIIRAIVITVNTSHRLSVPKGMTEIPAGANMGNQDLYTADIPNTVTTIGENAFSGCVNLKSVSIPNTVTIIGDNSFL